MAYDVTAIPKGCVAQLIGLQGFQSVAELPPAELVSYFRSHADAASRVLGQSYDKRYTPSTFIEQYDGGYRVGWFENERQHVRQFADISEAVADYILLSFGRGRLSC
jgi:hypothetical protein